VDKIIIEGGVSLKGKVRVSGAKNAVLPLMAASLLTSEPCRISNVPRLRDVETFLKLLELLGVESTFDRGEGCLTLEAGNTLSTEAPYELVKTMRASVLALGPLVARCGEARVSLPGGCAIGERPIDQHLKGMEALGANIKFEGGYVLAEAERLKGAQIIFDLVTVTGTMNVLMASTLAEGTTVLENAAREPEVVNLAQALNKMGARIEGAGTGTVVIEGVGALGGVEQAVIPDRIETGTLLAAGAITGGRVTVEECIPEHVHAVTLRLREAGVGVEEGKDWVSIQGPQRLSSFYLETAPYPGFPTDMQAQLMAMATIAEGSSFITETIFENRMLHVGELRRMGADITVKGNSAVVMGVEGLSGAPLMASDLRASAALVLAGLAAEGRTEVSRVYHLDRGYERLEEKLKAFGAVIWREAE
jgi:UDP-N-acetylglucosamine 1-carboxyvinyltransferase